MSSNSAALQVCHVMPAGTPVLKAATFSLQDEWNNHVVVASPSTVLGYTFTLDFLTTESSSATMPDTITYKLVATEHPDSGQYVDLMDSAQTYETLGSLKHSGKVIAFEKKEIK